MKIGLVCPYDLDRFGGVQDLVRSLAGWLADAGHHVTVVGPGQGDGSFVGVGTTIVVPFNGSAAPVALGPGVAARVRAAIEGLDVVHVHEPLVPLVSVAARRSRAALVGTFHADPSTAMRRTYAVAAPAIRRLLRPFDAITAVSPVAASAIAPVARAQLVPNGIDVKEFDANPGSPNRIAFLGRDDPRKGLDVLLAAWPHVRSEVSEAELVVASAGRSGELDGVRFIGGVGPDERRSLLGGASIYCAPNLGGESFGIVLVQAMASQCAVVASALPAFAHVLGDAGVLVKPGDAEGLARALIDLLVDHDRRSDLQRASLQRVEQFDRAAVTDGYLAVYADARERAALRQALS